MNATLFVWAYCWHGFKHAWLMVVAIQIRRDFHQTQLCRLQNYISWFWLRWFNQSELGKQCFWPIRIQKNICKSISIKHLSWWWDEDSPRPQLYFMLLYNATIISFSFSVLSAQASGSNSQIFKTASHWCTWGQTD